MLHKIFHFGIREGGVNEMFGFGIGNLVGDIMVAHGYADVQETLGEWIGRDQSYVSKCLNNRKKFSDYELAIIKQRFADHQDFVELLESYTFGRVTKETAKTLMLKLA